MGQIGILGQRLSVDGRDHIAHLHLAAGLAEGTTFENGRNLQTVGSLGEVVEQTQLGSGVAIGSRAETATRMTHI